MEIYQHNIRTHNDLQTMLAGNYESITIQVRAYLEPFLPYASYEAPLLHWLQDRYRIN